MLMNSFTDVRKPLPNPLNNDPINSTTAFPEEGHLGRRRSQSHEVRIIDQIQSDLNVFHNTEK